MLTSEYLRSVLGYDDKSGEFVWLSGRRSKRVAGCLTKDGYRYIRIAGRNYYAHRLAWLFVHGEWPSKQIDHRDGNKDNNGIANLRQATNAENAQNRVAYRTNKSGYIGVSVVRGRYVAQLKVGNAHHKLGYFDTPLEAHESYLQAKAKYHEFQPEVRQAV